MQTARKIRLLPTPKQEELFWKSAGVARWAYNYFLSEQEKQYQIYLEADQWYPSSKKCSRCGNIKKDLKLKDRIYKCEQCGLIIDRDYNASVNLAKYQLL